MGMNRRHIISIITLIASLLCPGLHAQQIVHVDVDTIACIGDSVYIGIGYRPGHEVVVRDVLTSISHPGRVFLPDGQPCGALGCSYRSPVTFSGFPATSVISSVNDINFVRLNLEHSWVGDIYIGLSCPSGQKVSLMNYGGTGTSSCLSTIPSGHRGWSSGSNTDVSTYFGYPIDVEDYSDPCDSSAYRNRPGTGWNYCWSNNTGSGYSYAPGDAKIYRSASTHNSRVDSSNVAAHTNFYHPDQSFSNLVGCPVNGSWYIEVIDGWGGDNGWIFDWELSLNSDLLPNAGTVTGLDVLGSEVTRTGDSTFLVSAPEGTTGDTAVQYTVRLHSSSGGFIDTVVTIHYYNNYTRTIHEERCEGDTVRVDDTLVFTETTIRSDTLESNYGCHVIRKIEVIFYPNYAIHDTLGFCPGEPIVWDDSVYADTGDYGVYALSVHDCDSSVYMKLMRLDSTFKASPLISDNGRDWSGDTMLAGCIPFEVMLKDTTPFRAQQWWFTGDGATLQGDELSHEYDSAGVFTITMIAVSDHGCRDTAVIENAVWTFEPPEAHFDWWPLEPLMSHPDVTFFNHSEPDSLTYLWEIQRADGGGMDSLHDASPGYTWVNGGSNVIGDFQVILSAIQTYTGPYGLPHECTDTAMATITIANDWLQFPNLVTPNGDGTNDIWKVVNLLECGEYPTNELWIYNSWGVEVYHARDIKKESDFWDPDSTGSPDGTYYFRFSAKSLRGLVRTNGSIEVVR